MTRQREKGRVAWVSVEVSHGGPQLRNFTQSGTQVQEDEALTSPNWPARAILDHLGVLH